MEFEACGRQRERDNLWGFGKMAMTENIDQPGKRTILILGGGIGGVHTALQLEQLLGYDPNIEIVLVSRDNYMLMTPLLFEAGSGVLEPRHAVAPIRKMGFKRARFVEAEVESIDLQRRVVRGRHNPADAGEHIREAKYDHLILALGGVTNHDIIPGSEHAMAFKTLGDAMALRNHIIDIFEQADVETDPESRRELLNIVVIGGGLVGVELVGEMTEFIRTLADPYPRVNMEDVHIYLLNAGPHILQEMDPDLAEYAADVLGKRGVEIRPNTRVEKIEPNLVHLPGGEAIASRTILLAAGVAPNPLIRNLPVEKGKGGRVVTDATMRVKGFTNVWALGDCAAIPDPTGAPYPTLAQHALREARVLARNVAATMKKSHAKLEPFVYQSKGTLAALGHYSGVGRVYKWKIKGFLAWWIWRSYYMLQMPRWDRRLRLILDWTLALFFRQDVVKLDTYQEPSGKHDSSAAASPKTETRPPRSEAGRNVRGDRAARPADGVSSAPNTPPR